MLLQGNCEKPFPTAESLGVSPFQPALPNQSPGQCMFLLDGSGLPSIVNEAIDVHFSHSGILCPYNVTECDNEVYKAQIEFARYTYPILVEKILFHSLNPSTTATLRIQRNAALTNVTLAGVKGKDQAPIYAGPARAIHVEGTVPLLETLYFGTPAQTFCQRYKRWILTEGNVICAHRFYCQRISIPRASGTRLHCWLLHQLLGEGQQSEQ